MHNAAFRALDTPAAFLAFDVRPEDLGAALAGARALGVRQLAISLPHKIEIMNYLDEVDPVARKIGAVNTVTFENGRAHGTNTDWLGAVRALERETSIAKKHAVVLGAGGTARSLVYGLKKNGATVTVLNRTEARAVELAAELGAREAGPLAAITNAPYDILINTTSVGLGSDASPVPKAALREGTVVLDAVYDPENTRLLKDAKAVGATTVQGKWMLIYQAAEQIRIWTGKEPPLEIMAAAFDRAGAD